MQGRPTTVKDARRSELGGDAGGGGGERRRLDGVCDEGHRGCSRPSGCECGDGKKKEIDTEKKENANDSKSVAFDKYEVGNRVALMNGGGSGGGELDPALHQLNRRPRWFSGDRSLCFRVLYNHS
ncbi:hypothetical protein RIF29_36627 [Crotalaria pallida]|uniref:Uncharacterized protein n=1 Tax=Crotalaria pallida TaxID=3830 RepID=A0AAN9HVV1_CROPI